MFSPVLAKRQNLVRPWLPVAQRSGLAYGLAGGMGGGCWLVDDALTTFTTIVVGLRGGLLSDACSYM